MGHDWSNSLEDPSPELAQKHILEDPSAEMAQKCFPNPNISSGATNEAVLMNPCEIKYSQATISRFFRKCILRSQSTGTYAEALKAAPSGALDDLLDQLKSGVVKVEDIPPIRVVWHKGARYTLDNRRLWVFRNFGRPIPVTIQNPSKEFFQKLDLQGDGETVAFQTSQSVAEYKQTLSLTTLILKWSLEDIQNDGLFINKIGKLPLQFSCMKKYLTSFVDPLLEETRAELKQCLEAVGDAPCVRLRGLEEKECKVKGALRKFELEVENQIDLKPSDIVLLATLAPTRMGDLLRFGEHYTLALLHGERRDDVENCKGAEQDATKLLRAEVYAPVEGPEYKELINSKRAWYLIYLTSLATALRTWKALHRPLDEALGWSFLAMDTTFPIIKEVLYPEGEKEQFSLEADVERGDSVLALTSYKFNRSQMNAIANTVFALINNERPYVRLIQGPPGTGKTTMLVGMLNVFCNMGKRVLMSAPTNTAICEVLTKFLVYLKFESTPVQPGDILLLGNKEKFPVEALSHVFLPDRAKRLFNVLHPVFGYRHKIMTMLELLENAEGMHEQFVACNPGDNHVSFLQFVRDKLECLGEQLMEAVEIACSDLPSKFLKSTSILAARNMLTAIGHLMMENVSDSVARSWFKSFPKVGGHFVMNGSASPELYGLVRALYELVRLLQENLNFVTFPTCTALTVSWLEEELVNQASVVFCTVSSSGRRIVQESFPFCVAIIDEASQLVEAETTIVMGLSGIKQLVLVGDHHQLPATIISNVARYCGYGRSLFQRLQMLEHPITVLNTQYRMHPAICTFPNTQFYNGELQNGPNVEKNNIFQSLMYGPYKFIDTINGVEMEDEGHSKQNVIEVEILVYVLRKLEEECTAEEIGILEVGIISPYSGQVKAIENRLQAFKFSVLQLEVKSVDGFQGREKDVILVSTVRSNGSGNIGFLEDYRRLNVAITRARSCLYIVGHASTLSARECIWKEMIDDAKRRHCFMNFGRNEEVCKLVKRIKIELNQLADLLNPSSILFDDTTWKVLFSKEFIASFTGIKSIHVKQNILHAILKLAKGQWPKHKFHGLTSEVFPDVINVRLSMGLYIVWSVDVQRDSVNQIIKVWNVVSAQKLLWTVKRLENLLLTYSESYLKRCKPNYKLDTKLAIPLKWKKDDMFVWYKPLAPRKECSLPSNTTLETTNGEQTAVLESLLLMKFYYLSSDRAWQLLTSFDGSNIELRFEVTEEEDRVLRSECSSFVVGRSGTGKTTVITHKLLQKEQWYWSKRSLLDKDNEFAVSSKIAHPALRQVIITVSSKLCAAIKHHITRFQRSLLGTGKNGVFSDDLNDGDVMLDEEGEDNLLSSIPNSFVDIPDESFPLVITYHKFLSMLDGSVSSSFLTLKAERRNVCHVNSAMQIEEDNFDSSDSENGSFDDEVRDVDGEETRQESISENAQEVLNPECIKCRRGREVNFDLFVSFYWVHFNSSLTKKFDASLVYMEIMSCIKGSIESLESIKGRLSREKYLLKALERNSTVDESQREEIYSLYLQYEKLKRYNGDYDLCDYVWHLHYQLKDGGFLGNMIDFIYVDEVQDLNLGQICLLKYVAKNIMDGFMFAGDTAQTIAKGVSFRFEDIRSLFYRKFLGIGKGCAQVKKQQVQSMLQMHQLSQNFRTHRGIIELADSVMRLILYFFPETVDKLHPEYSMILGDKPIIIKPVQEFSSIASLFGQGGTIGGMSCEFGAEQVILVRDQVSKRRIFEQIGRCGLVLTIVECKGLEFQDVLLYNFFTDSSLSQKWRVLYNYVQEKNISCGRKQSFPKFDSRIHNCLCSEFKQLYVAITRSKQRLWIYDEDFELQKPILDYWNALDLVQTMELNESLVSSFQSISTCTQWKDRGTQLFNDRQYDMAMLCFERAGDTYRKSWCEAAFCQQTGERKLGVDSKDAVLHLTKAAEIYKSLGKFEMAAKCWIKLKEFKQAGVIYQDLLNPPKLEEAGDCFADAKCWNEAADAYGRACSIQKCLSICGHVRLWEKGRMFIELWQDQWSRSETMYEKELRGKIDESTENMKIDFLKRAAQYDHRMKDMHSMMKFVNMFPKTSLKRIFLSRRDHHQELMQVEIIAKNYREASKVAEQMGNLELAAAMLEKDGSYVEGASKLVRYVRLEMLWGNDNKGWPLRSFDGVHLLTKAKGLAKGDLKLLNEIRILEASDAIIVQLLENYKVTRELNDGLVEIIVLHQLLDESIRSYTSDHSAILGPLLVDKCLDLQTFGPVGSLQLMILIWNQWYSKVSSLIKALVKLQKKPNVSGDEMLLDPCFGYLGVTPISGAEGMGFVNVDNSAASWLQKDELHSLSNQGKRAKVTIKRVSILAKEFWASQMVATGIECARLLEGCVDGNASVNDQCQLILKIIDIYTKLLDLEVMKKTDTDFSQEKILSYRLKLYDCIFLKTCGTFEISELREDGRVTVHLEKLLEGFLGPEGPGTYEELGRLEILLPFLSRFSLEMVKNKTIKMVCGGQASDLQSLIKFYLQNWINFYADFHEVSHCSCYFFGSIKNPGNALNDIFSMYSVKLKGYITPAAFIYLFERAFVVTYACLSHFEDMIISSRIVTDHMTGKRQEIMYSMMLKMSCDGGHQAWVKGLSALVGMGTYLLTRGNELLEWLKYSNVMEELPNVVFRLIRILATIYMDKRNVNEHANISQGLAHIFIEKSPILKGLPDDFRKKIQIAFDKSMTDSKLRSMFSEAMKLVGDPFVILRKRGKPRIQNTRMQIVHIEMKNGKFSLSHLKTKQLQDSKEKDRKLENETIQDEKVDINEDHKEDTNEDQKKDNYQVLDLSTDSSAIVPEESLKPSMQPWYISVDDRKLAWFIGWRLQRKLRLARDRLQEDDSVRIARLTFSRMGCNNSQYVETFVAQVCPLKVLFEEFLTEMNAEIQVMKAARDDLLDEMAEFQEESGSVLELLNSSHPGHRQFDVAWLESEVIRPAKLKLEEGKKAFGSVREVQPIQEQESKEAAHKKSPNKRARKKNRK